MGGCEWDSAGGPGLDYLGQATDLIQVYICFDSQSLSQMNTEDLEEEKSSYGILTIKFIQRILSIDSSWTDKSTQFN